MRRYLRFIAENARFIGFGFLLTLCSSFGQTFYVSLSNDGVQIAFGLTPGELGALYSGATLASGVLLIWGGRLIDDVDLRRYALGVCLCLAAACALMGWSPSVAVLAVALFALRFFGQGLMVHSSQASMARYFDRDRGKAMSLSGMGLALGEGVLPAVAVMVIADIGWRESWFVVAAVLAVAVAPMIGVLLRGHGERHTAMLERAARGEARTGEGQWTRGQVLRDYRFYLAIPAVVLPGFIVTGFLFHQLHFVGEKGWEPEAYAAAFAAWAVVRVAVALTMGPVLDRVGAVRLTPVFLPPMGAGLAVLALLDAPWAAWPYLGLMGAGMGTTVVVAGALWAEVYGVVHHGAVRALAQSCAVVSTAAAPVAFGAAIDMGVGVEAMAWICVGLIALGTAAVSVAYRLPPRRGADSGRAVV